MRVKWIQPKEKGKTEKDQMEIKRGGCGRVSEKWREGKESDASAVGTGEVMRRGEEIFFPPLSAGLPSLSPPLSDKRKTLTLAHEV